MIALTHMRWHNDQRLAQNVPGLDLILGGHDHIYETETINNIPILKSGSDFRDFSEISVTVPTDKNQPCSFNITRHSITGDIVEVQYMY